jgi:hypothetical protein
MKRSRNKKNSNVFAKKNRVEEFAKKKEFLAKIRPMKTFSAYVEASSPASAESSSLITNPKSIYYPVTQKRFLIATPSSAR